MERLFRKPQIQSQAVEQKKTSQKKKIIKTLYFEGPLANSDISKRIRLSTPKINSLLIDLIDEGIVTDLGRGDSSGGRRPNIYGLKPDAFYVVGISVNTHRTVISVFNSNNEEIHGPEHYPIKIKSDIHIFELIREKLWSTLSALDITPQKVLVIGMELPGLIDQERGINKTYFPDVMDLEEQLNKIFGIKVIFNHDTKIRTFAEQHFGLAKDIKNALVILADWGLGLGIIIDKKLYSGKSGYSGEFGHLPITDNGILCSCGKQGCLETIVSATAIVRKAKEGLENGNSSMIRNLVDNQLENINISTIAQAANSGDQFAISIYNEVGQWLGKGISYLLQIFNPERIIIGGRISETNQYISAPIQQAINTYSHRDISSNTEIVFSKLGTQAGTMGSAAYALEIISME